MIKELLILIAGFEDFHAIPYADRTQYSVGYGSKAEDIEQCITKDYALAMLQRDTHKHLKIVKKIAGLSENQIISLTSLSYNIGDSAFRNSTLAHLVQMGKHCEAVAEFDRWVFQNGKKLQGLELRRAKEKALFSKELRC